MKTEERVNQSGFAGAVRPKQTDRPAAQLTAQILQDWPFAKTHAQAIEFDDRRLDQRLRDDLLIFFQCGYHNGSFMYRMAEARA